MSRRTRNPFGKVSNLFKRRFDLSPSTSSSSNSPGHDIPPPPPNLTLRPPTPGSILPSSVLPASHALISQFSEPARFTGAHDFVLYHPQFNDTSLKGSGLKELLEHSMPDAFHSSAARYPPPKCHFGTRNDYITKITDWALGNSDHREPILWMRGPFGIGKSAVAQSCAEALQLQNKLAATLFFSRSNASRDDPRRVFTSIAYQVAAICEPFSNIVDARIRKDPAIATKSLSMQFEELLVDSLRQIDITRSGIKGCAVIIDGLDECRGSSEQCEIIRVIATSARDQTTPFRWFITSRPEAPIIRTMKSPAISSLSFHLELPVSREIDHEILLYLTDEFKKIRESYGLAESWPSQEVLALIVDHTAGLWIYVTTIIRFITTENSFGPEDQLRIVVEFAKSVTATVGSDNPLAEMDLFYTLILRQIPQKIITAVRKILLVCPIFFRDSEHTAAVLGLSEEQLRRSCTSIQSVMELQDSAPGPFQFHFYHTSFLDFMRSPKRSKELSIYGDFLIQYRRECLDWLYQVCSLSTGPSNIIFPSEPALLRGWNRNIYYSFSLFCFWELCVIPNHPFDLQSAVRLAELQFRTMLRLLTHQAWVFNMQSLECLRDNLPAEVRDKIIRRGKCPTPRCTNTEKIWIWGHGENETVAACSSDGDLRLINNQDHPDRCPCGSQTQSAPQLT